MTLFLFAEDFKRYLNISSNEEVDHLLKCLSEDMIQDENTLSQEDLRRLCAGINFGEEIPENFQTSTASTTFTTSTSTASTPIPLSDITLGDELNLDDILENDIFAVPLKDIKLDNVDFNLPETTNNTSPSFDLNFELDEIWNLPDVSTQEVSEIVKELEKVSVI